MLRKMKRQAPAEYYRQMHIQSHLSDSLFVPAVLQTPAGNQASVWEKPAGCPGCCRNDRPGSAHEIATGGRSVL